MKNQAVMGWRVRLGKRRFHGPIAAALALFFLTALPAALLAQPQRPIPDPVVDESFSIRLDEELFQLEEAVTLVAASLTKVADRTPSLAINSFHFGESISLDFRRKAEVIILDKVFVANPRVMLVECRECQRLETIIKDGVLRVRKGIPDQESRRQLAEKLGVDGFIDIGLFKDDGQLTVFVKVVEAKSGAIILVDELVGRRAPKRSALKISFGEMIFPLNINNTELEHKALVLSVTESVKLTERFSFSVDLFLFVDKNENDPLTTFKLDTGLLLAPTVDFDIIQLPSSTTRVILYVGIGKLLSPQLSYANLFRAGIELVVGDRISVLMGVNNFQEESVEPQTAGQTAIISGGGNEIRFGYRF